MMRNRGIDLPFNPNPVATPLDIGHVVIDADPVATLREKTRQVSMQSALGKIFTEACMMGQDLVSHAPEHQHEAPKRPYKMDSYKNSHEAAYLAEREVHDLPSRPVEKIAAAATIMAQLKALSETKTPPRKPQLLTRHVIDWALQTIEHYDHDKLLAKELKAIRGGLDIKAEKISIIPAAVERELAKKHHFDGHGFGG